MTTLVERALTPWAQRVRSRVNLPVLLSWGVRADASLALGDFIRPQVEIRVRDPAALPLLITPGLDTLGQAYVEGLIDVDGPVTDILAVAYQLAQTHEAGAPVKRWLQRAGHRLSHTRESDSEAIQYHYDVSNRFYAPWLGESMVYSCGYFEHGDETLDQAQAKKIDHILNKIQLRPGQRLLDIGCGWGALVLRAAQRFGAQCVGVTLSRHQFEWASERVRVAGLQDRVDIRLQDYRDVCDGPFDRITSVGMFEHVGLNHLAAYFGHIRHLLKPDGWALNHGITSTDPQDAETRHGGGRFIDRYVFPQGELPHIGTVLRRLQEGGLEAFDVENLRRHYMRTTQLWSQAFEANRERIRPLVDEKRWRIWRVYLAGCAWAFDRDDIAIYQVLCRSAGQRAQALPWSRGWMYPR